MAQDTSTRTPAGAARVATLRLQLADALGTLPPQHALREVRRCRDVLTAVEARVLAAQLSAGKSDRDVAGAVSATGVSKRNARAAARRGAAAAANPALSADAAEGHLSTDQFDVLADAAAKTGGAAACDPTLVEQVKLLPPDQGRAVAEEWTRAHADMDALEDEYARHRRHRRAKRWITKDGLDAITAAGDRTTIDQMWNTLRNQADQMYRQDGGRDLATRDHPRTHEQRLFDSLEAAISGAGSGSPSKATVVVTVDVTKLDDGDGAAGIVGSGPIPDSLLAEITRGSDVLGAVFGGDGQMLWLGRKRRHASTTQQLALIIRDKGCVLCGAHHSRCQAHHLMPWHAPGQGRTDIDQLALLCADCHHYVHDNELTVERLDSGEWKTRPATPDEIPPQHRSGNRPQRK